MRVGKRLLAVAELAVQAGGEEGRDGRGSNGEDGGGETKEDRGIGW